MITRTLGLEQLLVHAAWLRRFARALVRDDDAAEDVVQGTLVAAWQHPPAEDVKPRSWLARVAANRARDDRRGEGRRQAREVVTDVGRAEVASPEQLMGDLQIHREVAEVLTALEEPYRETLFQRYYEGLSGADIALRQGVPAGTVRWRLKEGLTRVRRALDDRHGSERERWRLALAPLLAGPAALAPTGATAPAAAAGLAGAGGRLLVAAASVMAAGALVAIAVGLYGRGSAGRARVGGPAPLAVGASPGVPSPGERAARRPPVPPRLAALPASAPSGPEPAVTAEADMIARHMLGAVAAGSYDGFLAFADDVFKGGLQKSTLDEVVAAVGSKLARGYTLEPLGTLRREDHLLSVWRLELREGGDEHLVRLAIQDGRAVGFWIE
jgi:RNA polymerase sigma-70 factor (ECF subfamily)